MRLNLRDIPDRDNEYFEKCARVRNVTKTEFFRQLLRAIAKDMRVAEILPVKQMNVRGRHRYKKFDAMRRPLS